VNYIFDAIIVLIVVISTLLAIKKGFAKIIFGVLAIVLSVLLSFSFSTPLANFTYDKVVYPAVNSKIVETVNETITKTGENISEAVSNSLPSFVKNNANKLGINLENLVSGEGIIDAENLAENICQNVVKPVAFPLIKTIITIVLMVVLFIVLKFLAKLLGKVFSFSFVGKINKTLGGIVGLVRGIAIAVLFVYILNLVISITGGFWILTAETVEKTKLYNLILQILSVKF